MYVTRAGGYRQRLFARPGEQCRACCKLLLGRSLVAVPARGCNVVMPGPTMPCRLLCSVFTFPTLVWGRKQPSPTKRGEHIVYARSLIPNSHGRSSLILLNAVKVCSNSSGRRPTPVGQYISGLHRTVLFGSAAAVQHSSTV